MRTIRAFLLTLTIYAGLMWAYATLRFLVYNIPTSAEFIDGISVTFWQLACISFVISGASCFGYLAIKEAA
jgi:hypothetical protein